MRILFLTQVLPYPLDAGPKIRAYFVLRYLAEVGHRITLVSFVRDEDRADRVEHLERYCEDVQTVLMRRSRLRDGVMLLYSLVTRRPFLIARDWVHSMTREISSVIGSSEPFDAIHADQLWMAQYAMQARDSSRHSGHSPLTVLDKHNAVFQIPRRLASSDGSAARRALLVREARKLARYEREVCGQFDRIVWVTDEDRRALFPGVAALPDNEAVIPIACEVPEDNGAKRSDTPHRVTFLGGLHWPPNLQGILWFRKEIWPLVRRRFPSSVLTVIGRSPSAELADGDPSVEVTGYVNDPAPYLRETAAFVVPLQAGGGMRVKILDAWAQGLPTVSTTIGAEGIQARHMENICLADTPGEFASAVIQILEKPELAAKLADGGRRTMESLYHWRKTYRAWDRIYSCESSS